MCGGDDVYQPGFVSAIWNEIYAQRAIGCSDDCRICVKDENGCFVKKLERKRKEKFPVIDKHS